MFCIRCDNGVDSRAHVDGLYDQPDLVWHRHHGSCRSQSASKPPRTRLATRSSSRPDCAGARRLQKRRFTGRHQRQRRLHQDLCALRRQRPSDLTLIRSPSKYSCCVRIAPVPCFKMLPSGTPHRAVSPSPAPPGKGQCRFSSLLLPPSSSLLLLPPPPQLRRKQGGAERHILRSRAVFP